MFDWFSGYVCFEYGLGFFYGGLDEFVFFFWSLGGEWIGYVDYVFYIFYSFVNIICNSLNFVDFVEF